MLHLVAGRWISQAISAAADLGIADVLPADGMTPDAIASKIGAHGLSVRRLLRALASNGVFEEDAQGRFRNTPLSEILKNHVPGSIRGMAHHVGSKVATAAWADLATSIRTGEPAFRRVHGKGFFDHLQSNPEDAAAFDDAMHGVSATEIPAILDAYDFSECGAIVDVGGGDGTLLCAVLAKYPKLRGAVYDLEHVVARTKERVHDLPEGARITTAAGSFLDSVPKGGDTYLLKHIIHDWDDARCLQILRNIRAAIAAQGRVLIVERPISSGNEPSFAKILDLEMLALAEGGLERTEKEYAALYEATGFKLARVVRTPAETCVIEGRPA
jgi:hypothetical protein